METPVPVRTLKLAAWAIASTWMTIQGLEVDVVTLITVKSQKRRNGPTLYASGAKNQKGFNLIVGLAKLYEIIEV